MLNQHTSGETQETVISRTLYCQCPIHLSHLLLTSDHTQIIILMLAFTLNVECFDA